MNVLDTERIPIKFWLNTNDIEIGALDQAKNLARLPFAFHHIAIMPDAHQGYGMPIGGVMSTNNVVVPNAVGVDIGCGMNAVKTSLIGKDLNADGLRSVMKLIRDRIPIGFNHHTKPQQWDGFDNAPKLSIIDQELHSAHYQLGTLGGGNHFLEIQRDTTGFVWLMLHSGSRNLGFKIAKHYNIIACRLCDQWFSELPDKELSFLPLQTSEAMEYLKAMDFALLFALESRKRMMEAMMKSLSDVYGDIKFEEPINVHHNYARHEHHFGRNVIVHRKGATSAKLGEYGIIPGSQGTSSHIVKGLGNKESFESCSHGAGRKMGRKQAQRELDLNEEIKKLDDAGIIHAIRSHSDLEEAPGAYKSIDIVMENQKDLVEIVETLTPLCVIKS